MSSESSHHETTLFDLSDWSQVQLSGADRARFLHNFCSADIKRLHAGDGCEAFLTDIKGRVLAHLMIAELGSALWLIGSPGIERDVIAHLDRYVITEDVRIKGLAESAGLLLLVGPEAPAVAEQELSLGTALPIYGAGQGHCGGHELQFMRIPVTVPPALAVRVNRAAIDEVRERLVAAGVARGDANNFAALRIDAGFPLSGVDITAENLAQEVGRTACAISFTKGCYLGQEPIARLDALGHVNRELRSLTIQGPPPAAGTTVRDSAGEPVGVVTSAASRGEGSVALAMLRSRCTQPDTNVTVGDGGGEKRAATVYWHPLSGGDA